MNMKKIGALILVIVLAVLLCVSCAKQEAGQVKYKIVNSTGEGVAIAILSEKNTQEKQKWCLNNMVEDQEAEITVSTPLSNGAPNLEFKFTTKSGKEFSMNLTEKGNKTITMKPELDKDNLYTKVTAEVSDLL